MLFEVIRKSDGVVVHFEEVAQSNVLNSSDPWIVTQSLRSDVLAGAIDDKHIKEGDEHLYDVRRV